MNLLQRRSLWIALTVLLLALIIWLGGPLVAIAQWVPLQSVAARLLAIATLAGGVVIWSWLRNRKARQASERIVADTYACDPTSASMSLEAEQLRTRFDEAIKALRAMQGQSFNLYRRPWYVIIGPPGAGKTTAIANSGLHFPLLKQLGKRALPGFAGTQNCDWWLTEEAVLIDTAGRYTTQDANGEIDARGWAAFLQLLCKHRGRRPLNGVIVAISAQDILGSLQTERERHIGLIRHRLDELQSELGISLPVYVIVTKLDLISGFTEFFDDLSPAARSQVLGATFELQSSRDGTAAARLGTRMDALCERVSSRLLERLTAERNVTRRAVLFSFPQQFAALRNNLEQLVTKVFASQEKESVLQLRGVYFTSATQNGAPVDRMISAMARTLGLQVGSASARIDSARAYFVEELFRSILFKETGLAGVNRRMELQQAGLSAALYGGVALLMVASLIAWSISYQRNHTYLAAVRQKVEALNATPMPQEDASPAAILDRLDALRDTVLVAERYGEDSPIAMRWGLYRGATIGNAARDAYERELNALLLPLTAQQLKTRLAGSVGNADQLYEYLKTYLMLGSPEHRDMVQLRLVGTPEWQRFSAGDTRNAARYKTHYDVLMADGARLAPTHLDEEVIARARSSLRQVSLPRLVYSRIRLEHAGDHQNDIDIGRELGLGSDAVFVRKSGRALNDPMPGLYTKPAFAAVGAIDNVQVLKDFAAECWVWGEAPADLSGTVQLMAAVMQMYEQDYIRAWDELLNDLAFKPANDAAQAQQQWTLLSDAASPLKALLTLVRTHTSLIETSQALPGSDEQGGLKRKLTKILRIESPSPAVQPGVSVTQHFAALHQLLDGSPARIDVTLQKFAAMQQALGDPRTEGGSQSTRQGAPLTAAMTELRTHAMTLPAPIAAIASRATTMGGAVIHASVSSDLLQRYQQQVVAECEELVRGRYPVAADSSAELPLADFARVFGPNGTFDAFYRGTAASFIDTSRGAWRWRTGSGSIIGHATIPAQFQSAARITQAYFGTTSQPSVQFTITPEFLDTKSMRMAMRIDGQSLEYRHGPVIPISMSWPGPQPGLAEISFEDRDGAHPSLLEKGPWAFFRLLEKAQLQAQSDTQFLATFNVDGHDTRLLIQASSARNPFRADALRGFGCQG